MAKNFDKDAQQLLDMGDVNQFQKDIGNYSVDALVSLSKIFLKYQMENDYEKYDTTLSEKIRIIKETRNSKQNSDKKVVKSISKVIAKVKEESKQELTQKPRNSSLAGTSIESSPDTPKNTGMRYNYQRGQGDFFGKSSAFKLIQQLQNNDESSTNENQMGFNFNSKVKKTRKASSPTVIKSSITHLDAKALKQIKDILMLPEKMAKNSSVKRTSRRQTKAEREKAQLKRDELTFKESHLDELKYKHRSDGRFDRKKFKEASNANTARSEAQKRVLEFREKVEENKLKRVKLTNELKEKLAQKHIEYSKLNIEKLRIKKQSDKDKQDGRLQLQRQRKDQTNRNQMERHLHAIHPALGLLYGMSQSRRESRGNQNNDSGGGGLSSLLGGLAGGAGVAGGGAIGRGFSVFKGMGKGIGSNALKLAGGRIPILGAGIAGISEGIESGSVGKGLATFAGALSGSALVGAAAGAVFGPLGAIVGAIAGNAIGMIAAKDIFEALNSKNTVEKGTPRNPYRNGEQNPTNVAPVKPKGYGRHGSLNSPQNVQSASGEIKKSGKSSEDFLAKEEGMRLKAYLDGSDKKSGKQFVSIGRGHQIKDHEYKQGYIQIGNERVAISGNNGLDTKLTKEQAEALYKKDNEEYSNKARNGLGVDLYDKLTDKQKSALNSYAYNIGSINGLVKKGLRDKIKSGDMQGASELIRNGINTKDGKYNKGLDDRRKKEAVMFAEKAPPKIASLQDSTNRMQQKTMEDKSKPVNVISVGGSSGGSSNVVNNTYVNPTNTDATPRQLANQMMYPGRVH